MLDLLIARGDYVVFVRDSDRHAAAFQINPQPEGSILDWVCRDNIDYLDIARDPLDLTPA